MISRPDLYFALGSDCVGGRNYKVILIAQRNRFKPSKMCISKCEAIKMIFEGIEEDVHCEVYLPTGDKIILFQRLVMQNKFNDEKRARNIYRLDSHGKVLWQVSSKFDNADSGPFLRMEMVDGVLEAYRWIGGVYSIDLETGFATPIRFEK